MGMGSLSLFPHASVLKSVDGVNWSPSMTSLPWLYSDWIIYYGYFDSPPNPTIHSYHGTFLVGGMDGILMQSGDTRVPIVAGSPQVRVWCLTFAFKPEIGVPYRVQGTTNFDFWENLFTGIGSNQPTSFVDPAASTTPRRFFRVVSP